MEKKREALDLIVTVVLFALGVFAARAIVPDILPKSNWSAYGFTAAAIFLAAEGLWRLLTRKRRKE